jgi:hypothetical protein
MLRSAGVSTGAAPALVALDGRRARPETADMITEKPARLHGVAKHVTKKTSPERLRQIRLWKVRNREAGLFDDDGHKIRQDRTPLRDRIEQEIGRSGGRLPLETLTVLHRSHDPYRIDNPAGHRDGRWFQELIERFLGSTATVHLRGFHYILVSAADIVKPSNGKIYRNTDADFQWLVEHAARHARWLGYVDFERIVDERNTPPEVYDLDSFTVEPRAYLSQGFGIDPDAVNFALAELVPSADLAMPSPACSGSSPSQPYRIVFIGEKVSLKPILQPIAERIKGELILPTGELSDTLLYGMMKRAAADSRPAVALYFADFDPSGYHMPVAVARKVQTLCDLRYPDLDIAIYPVALSFEQVRDLDLPSTPLKASERRADGWREHWGREQTEIDALAALQPDVLREIAETAIKPFYDPTLERRWRSIDTRWSISARQQMQAHPLYDETREALAPILDGAETVIAEFREQLQESAAALDQAQRAAAERMNIAVPKPYELPTPELSSTAPDPLYSSRDDWREATEKLIAYRDLGDLDPDPTEY